MRISDWSSDVCSSDLCSERAFTLKRAAVLVPPFRYVKLMRTACPSSPRWRTGECQPSTFGCDGRHGEALRRSCRGSHFDLRLRSEEHTSELQSLMRISYAVFCLNTKNNVHSNDQTTELHARISHSSAIHSLTQNRHYSYESTY